MFVSAFLTFALCALLSSYDVSVSPSFVQILIDPDLPKHNFEDYALRLPPFCSFTLGHSRFELLALGLSIPSRQTGTAHRRRCRFRLVALADHPGWFLHCPGLFSSRLCSRCCVCLLRACSRQFAPCPAVSPPPFLSDRSRLSSWRVSVSVFLLFCGTFFRLGFLSRRLVLALGFSSSMLVDTAGGGSVFCLMGDEIPPFVC